MMKKCSLVYGITFSLLFLYQSNQSVSQPAAVFECDQADLYIHPRSVAHKVFDTWISPDRFTKNPDMVELPSGRLLLVYSDNDAHWSVENQVLTILASNDQGKNWHLFSKVDNWKQVNYRVSNISHPEYHWQWTAESREYPNLYERERLIQIHANNPDQQPRPDHGYSSWIQQEDGTVFLVDYTNCGDVPEKSHLIGVNIEPDDLK